MLIGNACNTCPLKSTCSYGYNAKACPVSSLNAMHLLIKKMDPKQAFTKTEIDPYLLRTMPHSNQN
jgi:hypothetical protein